MPRLPHLFSMIWRDGAFLHWPLEPERLRPHVPDVLDLETYEGRAWVTIVPFVLARAGFRGTPGALRLTRPELNLRTYVSRKGRSGLYFFSVDIDGPWLASAARRALGVPCFDARQHVGSVDSRTQFSSQRTDDQGKPARFSASYRPTGPASRVDPNSLAHWLTGRRRMFVPRRNTVLVAEIAHEPWPLSRARVSIDENDLFEAADLPTPSGEPIGHYCDRLEITGSVARRLE